METQRNQAVRLLTGAAIGAGFAFLFLTKRGKYLLDGAEPWLDEMIRDMHKLKGTAAKVRDAMDEGRRSFEAVAELASFSGSAHQLWDEPHTH